MIWHRQKTAASSRQRLVAAAAICWPPQTQISRYQIDNQPQILGSIEHFLILLSTKGAILSCNLYILYQVKRYKIKGSRVQSPHCTAVLYMVLYSISYNKLCPRSRAQFIPTKLFMSWRSPGVLSHRHTLYFNYWDLSWRFYRFRYTFLKAAHWVATQLGHQWGFGDIAPFIFYYHFVFCCFDGFSSQLLQIEDTSHHEGILSHYKAEASTHHHQLGPSTPCNIQYLNIFARKCV